MMFLGCAKISEFITKSLLLARTHTLKLPVMCRLQVHTQFPHSRGRYLQSEAQFDAD